MSGENGVSGTALAVTITGAILVYSGIKGKGVAAMVRSLLAGQSPQSLPQTTPIGSSSGLTGQSLSGVPLASTTGSSIASTPVTGTGATAIGRFLTSKGLSRAGVAGVLGNLQVESGFNPAALNANEGAIGIAQWELGRRTTLQNYARLRGTSETDLTTQLNFLWLELTTTRSGALATLRSATDPATASAAFDTQFEGSAGTTVGARAAAARAWFTQGF